MNNTFKGVPTVLSPDFEIVSGFHSIAHVRDSCGHTDANTIVENTGNTGVLRCSASEPGGTAEFASRLIGKRGIIRRHVSRSRRPQEWLSSETTGEPAHPRGCGHGLRDRAAAGSRGILEVSVLSELAALPTCAADTIMTSRPPTTTQRLKSCASTLALLLLFAQYPAL